MTAAAMPNLTLVVVWLAIGIPVACVVGMLMALALAWIDDGESPPSLLAVILCALFWVAFVIVVVLSAHHAAWVDYRNSVGR